MLTRALSSGQRSTVSDGYVLCPVEEVIAHPKELWSRG